MIFIEVFHFYRILKATRKIRAGEIIFEEPPIFAGPSKSSKPICLVCLNEVYFYMIPNIKIRKLK